MLSDSGYAELLEKMTTVLHQDACICAGTLQMRVQKCFAIKVVNLPPFLSAASLLQ